MFDLFYFRTCCSKVDINGGKGFKGILSYQLFCALADGASLSGIKMARRTGNVEEFEFKAVGGNQHQGVSSIYFIFNSFFLLAKTYHGTRLGMLRKM